MTLMYSEEYSGWLVSERPWTRSLQKYIFLPMDGSHCTNPFFAHGSHCTNHTRIDVRLHILFFFFCLVFVVHRLFVGGHSAGGHLTACMLYTDWHRYGIDTQPLSGAILLSGIYDLSPIRRSSVNRPLNLTK